MKAREEDVASILVIRLGAMGDIVHALPAVASLKLSFPGSRLTWLVARKWVPLLEGNPYVDELSLFDRSGLGALRGTWNRLRRIRPALAIDFQGLFQSALAGSMAQPEKFLGFNSVVAREPLASRFYSEAVPVVGPHRIERNLQLIQAAGARTLTDEAWLPQGEPAKKSTHSPFVLASPFAGWPSKQWPLAYYDVLAQELKREGLDLVINVAGDQATAVSSLRHVRVEQSSISGLIAGTRAATAVVGVDSGPLHVAAALRKPGAAIFGPTDPAQTGPFGGTITVLRHPEARTSYKRDNHLDASMRKIGPEEVKEALMHSIAANAAVAARSHDRATRMKS